MADPDDTPPITWLNPEDFDALVERLDQPASYDPRIAAVLLRQPSWDSGVVNDVDNEADQPGEDLTNSKFAPN